MSKVIWHELIVIHERTNLSSELSSLQKLYAAKMPEHGDMNENIAQMIVLVDKLNQ